MAPTGIPPNCERGLVKQVISGDTLLIYTAPPAPNAPEKIVGLANLTAPRLGNAKRPDDEEPFGFQSRDALRKLLVGKQIYYSVSFTSPGSGREYVIAYLPAPKIATPGVIDDETILVNHWMVANGWAKLRKEDRAENEDAAEGGSAPSLISQLQQQAEENHLGIHSLNIPPRREVKYSLEDDASTLVAQMKSKTYDAIVEQVRDGSTVRVQLLPEGSSRVYRFVNVALSGIKAPAYKVGIEGQDDVVEPFGDEAKFFVENRLLQRSVKIIFESCASPTMFVASIQHPRGNIAELMLSEGLARIVDWMVPYVTGGAAALRSAERLAKAKRLRIWRDYEEKQKQLPANGPKMEFDGSVVKIASGDAILVRESGTRNDRRITFASIRQPKAKDAAEAFWNVEAKEFLRQRLIGEKVHVKVDYIKPAKDDFSERHCATVTLNHKVISEELLSKGLAGLLRHRADDDDRASNYDDLLSAEKIAKENHAGIHSKRQQELIRVVEASENSSRAKTFLSKFERIGRMRGVVEHLFSASRFKIYIPSDNCRVTLVLAGLRAPRPEPRPDSAKDIGTAALEYVSDLTYQRDVEVLIDNIDKNGGFIGSVWSPAGDNIAVLLCQFGFAHTFNPRQSKFGTELIEAEESAQKQRLGLWKDHENSVPQNDEANDQGSSKHTDSFGVLITHYNTPESFYFHKLPSLDSNTLPALYSLMDELASLSRTDSKPYRPKTNEICMARYSEDQCWYRARARKFVEGKADIYFVDFGNTEMLPLSEIRQLPADLQKLPPQAHEARLSFVKSPSFDPDYEIHATTRFNALTANRVLFAVVNGKGKSTYSLSLFPKEARDLAARLLPDGIGDSAGINKDKIQATYAGCINVILLKEGHVHLDRQMLRAETDSRVTEMLQQYEKEAKLKRQNIWEYGDVVEDED